MSPEHNYIRWPSDRGSWHVVARVAQDGWHLRCGRVLTTESAKASPYLPSGEKTCEPCATGTLRDQDEAVEDDPVLSEVDSPDATVPA